MKKTSGIRKVAFLGDYQADVARTLGHDARSEFHLRPASATPWQSNKLLDPINDGAVLPFLHLNGCKIANPTVLARIEPEALDQFLRGNGWTP